MNVNKVGSGRSPLSQPYLWKKPHPLEWTSDKSYIDGTINMFLTYELTKLHPSLAMFYGAIQV